MARNSPPSWRSIDCMLAHAPKGRRWTRCGYAVWVQGSLAEKWVQKSLNTRDWSVAAATIHEASTTFGGSGQYTGVPVFQAQENERPSHFFWDGKSERETTVKRWNRVLQKVFATCDPPVVGGHPHRFRDPFAIALLLRGPHYRTCRSFSDTVRYESLSVTTRHGSRHGRSNSTLTSDERGQRLIRRLGVATNPNGNRRALDPPGFARRRLCHTPQHP